MTTIPDCVDAVHEPRGRRLAGFALAPDRTRRACVWDAETGAEIARLEPPAPGLHAYATSLAFSPDGQRVAASIILRDRNEPGSASRFSFVVWDVASGKIRQMVQDQVGTVAFSPDGSRLAGMIGSRVALASMSAEVGLWDAATGRLVLALKGHSFNTASSSGGIAFSPDGRRIVSAVGQSRFANSSADRIEIRQWDATPWTATP